jgi:hypothetical protein
MITRKVKVDTIEKVKNFTNEIGKFEASADLGSIDRRYTVDAKSKVLNNDIPDCSTEQSTIKTP